MTPLSQERLKELLDYSPETGEFRWKVDIKYNIPADSLAGCVLKDRGYVQIRIDGSLYYAHRLAWLYVTGSWPSKCVDHINQNRADNSFSNLRDVSSSVNNANRKNVKGYHARPDGSFEAYAFKQYLGLYRTAEEARDAHLRAKRATS